MVCRTWGLVGWCLQYNSLRDTVGTGNLYLFPSCARNLVPQRVKIQCHWRNSLLHHPSPAPRCSIREPVWSVPGTGARRRMEWARYTSQLCHTEHNLRKRSCNNHQNHPHYVNMYRNFHSIPSVVACTETPRYTQVQFLPCSHLANHSHLGYRCPRC